MCINKIIIIILQGYDPYGEDENNLEGVIKNDLDVKNALEDLTKTYDQAPGDTKVKLPYSSTPK